MRKNALIALLVFILFAIFIRISIPSPLMSRALIIALLGLILWLTELVPFPATTLFLFSSIPLFLGTLDSQFSLLPF